MQLTPNYNLKKPEGTDPVDIQDFNDNADAIDAALKKKAESSGGDISEMTVKTLDNITTDFPVPVAGEKPKSFLGKVKKFFEDTKSWMTGVCLIGQIVNNCVTNNAKLPLSAAQGKVLMDLYNVLNTNLANGYPLSICIKDELENSLLKIQGFADGNSGISLVKADGIVHRMFINSDGRFRFGTYSNGIWNIADVITNADIQAGNTPLGDCVPGKTTDFQIIFPKPFSSIPKVMVCLRSSSQSEKYGLLTPYVANISKTSFTFRVANAHTTLLTPGGTWYAML
ncbi:hypothetical protein DW690_19570 [Dorea longicatena]|jgi:hypothetical protein|nr:hypothetical protein DW690_19570 [Dorea longicatena]